MPFIQPSEMDSAVPLPGWNGRFWRSSTMSFAHYDFEEGASIHEHHHPNEEVWLVLEGELEVTIDGATQLAGPGAVAVVPPDVPHAARVRSAGRAIVANHPVRHDLR